MSNAYQHISAGQHEDVVVLTYELERVAEYDVAEAVGKELIVASQQESAADVIVDMRNVEFMSSVGYGPLITLRSRVRESGRRLDLCNLSGLLQQMFETTRLLINPKSPMSLFEYAGTLEDALRMLSSNG